MFANAKGKQQKVDFRNRLLNISHITFRDCRMHIFPTTFLEMAVYGVSAKRVLALTTSS